MKLKLAVMKRCSQAHRNKSHTVLLENAKSIKYEHRLSAATGQKLKAPLQQPPLCGGIFQRV